MKNTITKEIPLTRGLVALVEMATSMEIPNTIYRADMNALECLHCGDVIELRKVTGADPEVLALVKEEYEMEHSRCHEFKDIEKANQAREFRTEGQRRKLHEAGVNAVRVLGGAIH